MFTIGLEMSFSKLKKMREVIFINGSMQAVLDYYPQAKLIVKVNSRA
ncbi:MAG: CPA2 family monovalent cation:H+ antiporter-2 [Paraglaciecola sp.]|jgi:CPA2 family monovalent cation:H+ antiporter-2